MEDLKILIVEDLATDVEIARRSLKKEKISFTDRVVDTAEDFEKALAEFKPDLIISDYAMPRFDGMSALKITRSRPYYIPFIVLTGSMNEETAVACMKAGADDYVLKEKIRRLPFAVREVLQKDRDRKEKEQAKSELRESEEKYRILFEHTSEALFVAQDGRIVFHNPRTAAFSGYSSKQLLSEPFIEFIHEDDREMVLDNHIRRLRGEKLPERYVVRIIHRDGGILWGEISAVSIQWNGKPASLNFLSDITERKQAEKALRESEDRFKKLASFTFEGIVIHNNAIAIDANQSFVRILGYEKEEIIGMNLFKLIHPDYHETTKINLSKQVAAPYQILVIRKDGSTFYAEVEARNISYKNEFFRVACVRDITERKQAEEALRQSEAKYRTLVNSTLQGVVIAQADPIRLIFANPAMTQISGYTPEKLIGMGPDEIVKLIYEEDRQRFFSNFQKRIQGDSIPQENEYRVETKDGTIKWVALYSSRIEYQNKPATLTTFMDITGRKQAEEEIQKKEFEKSAILDSMLNAFVLFESVFDENGKFVSYRFLNINRSYEEITGVKLDEVKGKTVHEVWPGTEPEWIKRYGEVAVTGASQQFELYHDPTKKLYRCQVYRPFSTNTKFCVIFENITDLKQAEERLRESESRMRAIVEGTPNLFFYTQDTDGKITYISPSVEIITGYSVSEWHNRLDWFITDKKLYEYARSITHAHLRGEITKDPIKLEIEHADKRKILLEIYENPVFRDGKVVGIQGVAHDITERKRAEEELKRIHRIYQETIENANGVPYSLYYADKKYNFVGKGIKQLIGMDHQKLTFEKLKEISREVVITDHEAPSEPREYVKAFRNGTIDRYQVDLRIETPGGEEKWISDCSVPIRDEKTKKVIGSLGIMQNITERKQAEQALKISLQEKTQLISELYHRTKNNMQVIMSMLKIQSGRLDDIRLRKVLQESVNRIHAMALVHEKLYQSQNLSRIDLGEYIRELTQLLMRTYHVSPNKVKLSFDLEPIPTLIDFAVPCGLILNELISNIFKYAFPGEQSGEIHIGLHRLKEKETISLTVSDNGIGLPEKFDYRKSKTFGLPIIVAIVEHQLQGKIEFEGENGLTCRIQFRDDQYEERV